MEIRVLRYFLTVVREESITKAAEVLHITQPTLSRQLAQLEEEMGVKLFDRGSRKIKLTNEGILLLYKCWQNYLKIFIKNILVLHLIFYGNCRFGKRTNG